MNEKWFTLDISQIEKKLRTNAATGLSRKAARSAWHRSSSKSKPWLIRKTTSVPVMIKDLFSDFVLIILLFATLMAVLFGEKFVGNTVFVIIAINLISAFIFYYRSQRMMEYLGLYFSPTANVIRGGALYRTTFQNVVCGDVIIVQKGDIVCGDARLVTSDRLRVSMPRADGGYSELEKQAIGVVAENENDPEKYTNMIHAGSVVLEGSARAIVVATGAYTYIGAMTGGISEQYSMNVPDELKKMKKALSQISLVSMLCVLPVSIISLFWSHFGGGNSDLSYVFLTALSIAASSACQLSCTACKAFFASKAQKLIQSKNAVAVRSTDAFDKMQKAKYLFLLDGSAVTDGILHFDTCFTAEGETNVFNRITSSQSYLFDMATLYNIAEKDMLTLGIQLPKRYKSGIDEFLSLGKSDAEALAIRCPIKSYMQGGISDPSDRVFFSENGKKLVLNVSSAPDAIAQCSYCFSNGHTQELSPVSKDRLRHAYNKHAVSGKTVLVFTVSDFENVGKDTEKTFIGAIVLREMTDKKANESIAALKRQGIKVISFVRSDIDQNAPKIPVELQGNACANKEEFEKRGIPITYGFGEFSSYLGFSSDDVVKLLKHAKKDGQTVAAIGFSDEMTKLSEHIDILISCSSLINISSARDEQQLYTLEARNAGSSTCAQTLATRSDILIKRPVGNSGGLSALNNVFSAVKQANKNLVSFYEYSILSFILRVMLVIPPIIFGNVLLDIRHVLLSNLIIDMFVLVWFAFDKGFLSKNASTVPKILTFGVFVKQNVSIVISLSVSCILSFILPMILEIVGFFGPYLYRIEYMFVAMIALQIAMIYMRRYYSVKNIIFAIKDKWFPLLLGAVIIFFALLSSTSKIGLLFDFEKLPIGYFISAFIPSAVFMLLFEIFKKQHKMRK